MGISRSFTAGAGDILGSGQLALPLGVEHL